jgi:hypothetical protein
VRISLSTADRPAALLEELVQQELLPHARCRTPHVQIADAAREGDFRQR